MISQQTSFTNLIKSGNFLILDTETTGLYDAEICQIAIVDSSGKTLLNTYVKPVRPIPADAIRIHGITDEMVKDAPGFLTVKPRIEQLIRGQDVVIYNSSYDVGLLHTSAHHAGSRETDWWEIASFWCAMSAYAEFYGDWNDYHQSYTWQKLTTAIRQQRLGIQDAHSALGDCLMTLALVNKVWGQ